MASFASQHQQSSVGARVPGPARRADIFERAHRRAMSSGDVLLAAAWHRALVRANEHAAGRLSAASGWWQEEARDV